MKEHDVEIDPLLAVFGYFVPVLRNQLLGSKHPRTLRHEVDRHDSLRVIFAKQHLDDPLLSRAILVLLLPAAVKEQEQVVVVKRPNLELR